MFFLFGSVAKGTNTEDSDIDMAVSEFKQRRFLKQLEIPLEQSEKKDIVDLDECSPFVEYLKSHGELQRVG